MSLLTDISRAFRLYVTHVDGEGHFLRISGQLDQPSSLMIETLFETARENLEKGIGAVNPAAIQEGLICAAKYKDGTYYRAKIINTTNLSTGLVGVHFIDYGNKDVISLSTIRFLDNYDPMLTQLRGQASDYYLARVMHPSGRWDEPLLLKLQSLLCYADYPATVEAQSRVFTIVSIQFKGNDLSSHLVSNRFGIPLPLKQQEVLLLQPTTDQQIPTWQPNVVAEPSYTEHVPFLINHNYPSNPASAMRMQQNMALPFNGSVPPPSAISQRLLVNKASRSQVNLKAPMRQPQHVTNSQITSAPPLAPETLNKTPSPKKSITYKSRLLEVKSQHKVFVSFAEEGPELFAVQLVTDAKKLQDMMDDINRRPHSSLIEPPMIGTVCLGRMSGDRIICRAIVMNLSGSQCNLFFVDFGDTEMVSYYDIFDIPEEFVKPNVFAMRFCLSGVKKLEKGPHLNEAFKQLVNGKVLTLRVVSPEGPPLIQYGELYLDNMNVLDLLLANTKGKLQFKWMETLQPGSTRSALVSYVDSCIKFYIQLSDKIDELNAVMDAVKAHCESTSCPGELPVGAACCARFPDDDNWYRARIKDTKGTKVVVAYVDYGNEQEVEISDLRTITPELIKLPAQALKCALKGFENKPVETKTSNQLEMLALEKTLMCNIIGNLTSDTMLVSLVDDTVNPPLDVARRMTQLSQPRSNLETKATTPVRKDAPETFSSPEGSEDSKKKSFRREKSFKEERRPPREGNEEFGQRGSSFRSRDNKEPFDRSGSGRHSEKFGGRSDRGDRRGGPKPWEANVASSAPAPAASDDQWEESPAPAPQTFQPAPRQNRDNNRDRDNKFNQQDEWEEKKDDWGNKRENRPERSDRRDNRGERRDWGEKKDNWGEKKDNWGEKKDNRGEKKDNRGEKKDNWGEKKDNWGEKKDNWGEKKDFQKREFRDNRERGANRTRSNYTPRDRVERSFGSDGDKKSDKSFRSQDNGRGGRASFKPRSKFTEPSKELSDPVPLETPFETPTVEPTAQHEISVTWIISPENFYTQILSLQPKFLDMMNKIPQLYEGVKPYNGNITVGSSVLAKYPIDRVLYRATVIAVQPFSKFIVQYVDFGNKQLVGVRDIWQLDRQLFELPKMAVHCSLLGVGPKEEEWKASPDIDLCFNGPRYQCVFQECVEGVWKVSLWNNGVSVADTMVEKQLAVPSEHQSAVALKDEAIDLTIIVGQQILCKVTHVASFEQFHVQLDLDKAALVDSAIANIDRAKLTPLTADNLMDGVHCTVTHEGKIYRAILSDVADTEHIQAVLPDYGTPITTALDKLMILPTELTVYYYQSLQCNLFNYSPDSKMLMTLDELKTRLTGHKFINYINSVEDIRLQSTLYDIATGQKVAIFEPDEGAYDEVVQLCTRAVFNYNFGMAYISHSENLNEFYLQKTADSDRLAELLDELYKFYEEGTPEPLATFEEDTLCAAKSTDGNWYRATVISAEETSVKVHFSDYGNSEVIPKEAIKTLDAKFFEPCALALVASLGLVALQDNALAKLIEWTTDKDVLVTVAFGTDGWLASLHLDGVDLSMKLVNEKLATPKVSAVEEPKAETPVEEPVSLLPEGCTQVYISHIDTPGHFWLQMADKVDKIEEIQADLQANAGSYPDIENREMGTLCIAKYLADDQWYRAEILDSDSDITTVRFIDYGNTDVLDNTPDLIKAVPDHLKDIERYALKSSVNAVPTGTGEWSEPSSDYFTQLVGDLADPVDAMIVLKDVTTYVDIYVNGQNLTDKLVAEGYAARSEATECGDLPSCFASHINSPSEFWIQLETAAPELQTMESAMVDADNFPELTEKEEGVICAAKYPEDGAWYRAQVVVNGSEGTEVLFMDYGNASIANELRSLPDELKVKPPLSRKCALQKSRDIKSWSRKSEIKFNELAAEGATIFNVQFIASGDISIVELYLEGKSVTEELVGLCEEHPPTERPTPVGQDLRSTGKVCYVNSLEEFYVQLDATTSELDKVFDRLGTAGDFESATDLKVGSMCAAFWDEDDQWYRARILEFCDGGYHVQFVDYGNKAKCEVFRQLPEDLAVLEPLSKCCRLAGLGADSATNDIVKAKLDDLAAEVDTTFQIEFLDSTKEPALVKLWLNDKDIISVATSISTVTAVANAEVISENVSSEVEIVDVAKETNPTENVDETSNVKESDTFTSSVNESITAVCLDSTKDNTIEEVATDNNVDLAESKVPENEPDDQELQEDELCSELNTSQTDLNESIGSSNTVIENKEFEAKVDDVPDPTSPEKDISSDTLEISNETIKTADRDDSKDSVNTDTGYTSEGDHEKSSIKEENASPLKECISAIETGSPVKETVSPVKESVSPVKETVSPSIELETPVAQSESVTEIETPLESPEKESVSPIKEPTSPKKEVLPANSTSSPKTESESPKKDAELVTAESESPKKQSELVLTEPKKEIDSPIKETSPKNESLPTSPNKESLIAESEKVDTKIESNDEEITNSAK